MINLIEVIMGTNDDISLKLLLASAQQKIAEMESIGKIGTWEYVLSTHNVSWSAQMFQIFDREVALGNPNIADVHEFIYSVDRFQWELLINKVSIDGSPMEVTLRILDANDEIKWVKKSAKGVFVENRLVAISGYCQDITEIKRLENHYELTRQFFEEEK